MNNILRIEIPKLMGKERPRFARGVAYTPKKTKDFEKELKLICRNEMKKLKLVMSDKPIKLTVAALFEIPKSYTKKRKEKILLGQEFPTKKPDADNILKIAMDSLNKEFYNDDCQVVEVRLIKQYANGKSRIVIIAEEMSYQFSLYDV